VIADGLFAAVQRCGGGGAGSSSSTTTTTNPTPSTSSSVCSLDDLVVAKARCERDDDAAATEFAFSVLDAGGGGLVPRDRLTAAVQALLQLSMPPHMQPSDAAASAVAIADG